uniref:Calcineurin-like phosphoesterase domain-containing protein n=1 Tax=viral metagenome TaxID=1070528 RepID=A0A6C0ACP8_9ZZZZ
MESKQNKKRQNDIDTFSPSSKSSKISKTPLESTLSNMTFDISKNIITPDINGNGQCNPDVRPPVFIEIEKNQRVIGIGDIHGDLKLALQSLVIARVIPYNKYYFTDEKTVQQLYEHLHKVKWIGGNTIVVQVGDQVDRCRPYMRGQNCRDPGVTYMDEPSDIVVLDFFTHLHLKAIQQGGMVISLYGNHELMNMNGDMRYVSKLGIDQFENINLNGRTIKDGLEGRIKFFERGGNYSKILGCSRLSVVVVGSTLFAHAGVIEQYLRRIEVGESPSRETLIKIDNAVKDWVLGLINPENTSFISSIMDRSDSLFWNRILGAIPSDANVTSDNYNETCRKSLDGALEILGLERMVIGHTPFIIQGISPACNKKLYRVDIGASKAFKKFQENYPARPQVLEILEDVSVNVLT